MKSIKIILGIALLLSVIFVSANAQKSINFREELSAEVVKKWDEYIRKYAPADSAFNVVIAWANKHFAIQRAAVAKYIYEIYIPLFPQHESIIMANVRTYEQIMLSQTPTRDMYGIYNDYIKKNAPSEDAFVAVQRISDDYIEKKMWDSAVVVYEYYKQYFPTAQFKFNKIIDILKKPIEGLKIRNLGPVINTGGAEWDPTPTPDGRFLYFTAEHRRGGNGASDIWVSEMVDGKWTQARNLGRSVNNFYDETIDNVSVDGTTLMLSGNFEGTYGKFDIYFAEKDSTGWKQLFHLPRPINTEYHEESANLSPDGKVLVFTSDKPNGIGPYIPINTTHYHGSTMGNMDIYVSFITDSGWSAPKNLGPVINTPYAERAAFLHPDGKTLYFSSDGHPGLGRLDVYKSVRLDDSWTNWSEPVNLGKEINSQNDDWGYNIDLKGDSAFFAIQNAADGYGNWDIYSVSLPKDAKPDNFVTVRGKVKTSDGRPVFAQIKWEDLTTGENIGILKSDPADGSYIITLNLGRQYGYYAERAGYYPASANIDLRKTKSNQDIYADIILYSKKEIQEKHTKVIINNIFFDFDKYELKKESYSELNRLVDFLKADKSSKILIEGHTDNSGTKEYNQKLSLNRANSVAEYLIGKGVDKSRIKVEGYGNTKPLVPNTTEENKAKNRRVEFSYE